MFSSNASQVSNDANYIEDVFSTYLYTGAATALTINNGIDLAGEGGLVWIKKRSAAADHWLTSTANAVSQYLGSAEIDGYRTSTGSFTAFNANGFTVGNGGAALDRVNTSGSTYTSWTFRKQPKFFDVVTWTGNDATSRQIAHSLGSTPGCIIVKCTNASTGWVVYHKDLSTDSGTVDSNNLVLNNTGAQSGGGCFGDDAYQTSTYFTLGRLGSGFNDSFNRTGRTYVAYLFAHNAGGFGLTGTDNVISCGSYTGTGAAGNFVSLGYEPQWLLIKRTNTTGNWLVLDNMRGITTGGVDAGLFPNLSNAEDSANDYLSVNATGFELTGVSTTVNASGSTYIYIAIRRGPMKTPTTGTSVLGLSQRMGTGSNATVTGSAGVTDLAIIKNFGSTTNWLWSSRMTNTGYLSSNDSTAETTAATTILQANPWDVMDGVKVGTTSLLTNASGNNFINYLIDRAPGFMDVCCYTGTGVARTVAHNLGVAPELMIVKARSAATAWIIYHSALGNNASLSFSTGAVNTPSTTWNTTTPTSSSFTVGTSGATNGSSVTLVAYLFASCPGVSKVGSYTGTATTQQINCGFTGGARFVLIKRTDSTGDWYVWDSARGIEAGNDGYLLFNSTAIQATGTDYVDTYSAGFEISSTAPAAINASGGSFIFLAIA